MDHVVFFFLLITAAFIFISLIWASIISVTEKELGVRKLKQSIEHIIARFNILRKTILSAKMHKKRKHTQQDLQLSFVLPNFTLPYEMTPESVDILMQSSTTTKMNPSVRMMYT